MRQLLVKLRTGLWLVGCCQACFPGPQESHSTAPGAPTLHFEYLQLRATLGYSYGTRERGSAQVRVRIHKDQRIWLTVSGPWGVELLRGQLTPTHVTLLYPLQQAYAVYTYAQLPAQWAGLGSYAAIQAWLLGEVADDSGATHQYWLHPTLGKVTQHTASTSHGHVTAVYSQFKPVGTGLLWTKATFTAQESADSAAPGLTVTFTKAQGKTTQKPLRFPFEIPAHYEQK